jgi:drug/metabolite transporter (DMT)-like permease
LHLARGALGFTGYVCGYYAIGHMPLADFYTLVFTAPLFTTALSALVAGESVDPPRWLAVVVGFAGVLVMVRPGAGLSGLGMLAGLGGSLFYALSVLLVRRLGRREKAVTFGVYGALVMVGGAGLLLPATLAFPDRHDLLLFAVSGVGMGAALRCVFAGFGRTPAAVLAPFQYTQMIWGVLAGLVLFGEQPDGAVALGSLLVAGSGLYILYRETRAVAAS